MGNTHSNMEDFLVEQKTRLATQLRHEDPFLTSGALEKLLADTDKAICQDLQDQ